MTQRVVYVAAAALRDAQGRILLAQRPQGKPMAGLWEFPGGKLEAGEAPETALIRELQEELGITLAAQDLQPIHFVSHAYEAFHLIMLLYGADRWQGEPVMRENQSIAWVAPADIASYDLPAADIPLLPALLAWATIR